MKENFIERKVYKGIITELPENGIFVFGSNTQGRHGKGAAKTALNKFGAIYGNPKGRQGKSYAIITKDLTKKIHPSISGKEIINQIRELYKYAEENKDLDFYISYNADSIPLNGYTIEEIAIFFASGFVSKNIIFEEKFHELVFKNWE